MVLSGIMKEQRSFHGQNIVFMKKHWRKDETAGLQLLIKILKI